MSKTNDNNNSIARSNQYLRELVISILVIFLIVYIILLIIEFSFKGFVSNTINPNYLLLIIIPLGVISSLLSRNPSITINRRATTAVNYLLIFLLLIINFFILYNQRSNFSNNYLVLSVFTGLIIFLLGIFILIQDNKSEK